MAEGDASLAQVVRGEFDIDLISDADANEVLAHLAGDVREDLVACRQRDPKHGAGQHLRDGALQANWFFFWHDC